MGCTIEGRSGPVPKIPVEGVIVLAVGQEEGLERPADGGSIRDGEGGDGVLDAYGFGRGTGTAIGVGDGELDIVGRSAGRERMDGWGAERLVLDRGTVAIVPGFRQAVA